MINLTTYACGPDPARECAVVSLGLEKVSLKSWPHTWAWGRTLGMGEMGGWWIPGSSNTLCLQEGSVCCQVGFLCYLLCFPILYWSFVLQMRSHLSLGFKFLWGSLVCVHTCPECILVVAQIPAVEDCVYRLLVPQWHNHFTPVNFSLVSSAHVLNHNLKPDTEVQNHCCFKKQRVLRLLCFFCS